MVWENVPGAFSSNGGKDFAAVLEEAIRIAEPEAPDIEVPEKGWNTWGGYHDEMGGRWSVAWRVLDAQHWGVPQRRRRIALVADFGGDTAWEILFERQSMSGYPAESGAAWEGPASGAESGSAYAVRIRGGCDGGGKGALVQTEKSGTIKAGNDQTIFCLQGNAIDRADTAECNGKGWKEDVYYTLNTIDRPAACAGPDCLTPWDCQSKRVYSEAGVMPTLQAGENSGQNQEAVLCAGFKLGNSEQARSIGYAEEQAPTLNAECGGNKPAVLCLNDQGGSMMGVSHDVSGTLRAQEHGHQPAVIAFAQNQREEVRDVGGKAVSLAAEAGMHCQTFVALDMSHACDVIRDCGEVAPSLQARMGTGGKQIPLTYQKTTGTLSPGAHPGSYNGQDAYNDMLVCGAAVPDIAHTLKAKANCDFREDSETYPVQNRVVRRLTPLECERLQGFPDGWTDIGDWVKTDKRGRKIKVKGSADSPRYKALGNSIALPPWKWLLKRLCGNYERNATMASLFDGIGGFPLIWEQLNGYGTCLWASEIEEFPIAVTKRRFGTLEEPGDMGRFLFPCGNERSGT
jgi:DNA (cytosine-5)-methyltransferase 1